MNRYIPFMQQLVDYMQGTWLANPPLIAGCSSEAIREREIRLSRPLPASLWAWYAVAGKVPPSLNDYDADYSMRAFDDAQEVAPEMMLYAPATMRWQLDEAIIPFNSRLAGAFQFVDTSRGADDDPEAGIYVEGDNEPTYSGLGFSAYLREIWIAWLDWPLWSKYSHRRDRVIADASTGEQRRFDQEVDELRRAFAIEIYEQEKASGDLLSPRVVQERWRAYIHQTDAGQRAKTEDLYLFGDWTEPPKG